MDESKLAEFRLILGLKITRYSAESKMACEKAQKLMENGVSDAYAYRELCEETTKARVFYDISYELQELAMRYLVDPKTAKEYFEAAGDS